MVGAMSISAPPQASDPVALVLGPELAALRRHVLERLVPQLDTQLEGVAEDAELEPVYAALAADPHGLLDPRSGGDLGLRAATVATEALATGRQTYLIPVLVSALARTPILLAGSDEQRERFLTNLGGGRRVSFAMSEPHGGSDVAGLRTTARRRGDTVVLDGRKRWITVPGELDWFVCFAKPLGDDRPSALSAFVVEAGMPGVTIARSADPLGMRAVPLCDILLDGVELSPLHQLGADGRAFGLAMRSLNAVRCIVGARGLGLTANVLMSATRWVQERGLDEHQLVRAKLGELAARLEAARLLVYRAAALADAGCLGKEHGPVLAASKLLATELAVDAATACMHLAGAPGYDESLPFARALRDAQQLTMVEGVSEVQLELVARGLLDRSLWWDGA